FVTYRVGDKNSPPGIVAISETSDGNYWIATTGGFYRFRGEALSRPGTESGDRQLLNAEYIGGSQGTTIEDRQGNIWYVAHDLYLVHQTNGKVEFEKKSLNLPETPNRSFAMFHWRLAPDGSFWVNTNQGLVRRLPDGRGMVWEHENRVRQGTAALTVENNGRVWVAWGNEIYVLMPEPWESLPQFDHLLTQPLTSLASIAVDPDHKVSLPDRPGQIVRLTEPSL